MLASAILQRPANAVVLVIASGRRAGEMIGTDLSEFSVGFSDECLVCFQSDKQTDGQARVVFSRSSDGWFIRPENDGRVYVNEHFLSEERPLRSGDIIRLSANGPDLQFTLQSGGIDVRQLAKGFHPGQTAQNAASDPSVPAARLFQPTSWSRQQKTWAILLGCLCLFSSILFLPSKKASKDLKTDAQSPAPKKSAEENPMAGLDGID